MAFLRPLLLAASLLTLLGGCESTEPPREISQAEADPVMLKLFSIKTLSPMVLKLPEQQVSAALGSFVEGQSLAKGEFVDGPVRGSVLLDYARMQALNAPLGNKQLLLAPFVVANQGSGSFWYLGLFALDTGAGTIAHLDSSFLGDRVALKQLKLGHQSQLPLSVNAELLLHGPQQAMAEPPGFLEIRRFRVTADGKLLAEQ